MTMVWFIKAQNGSMSKPFVCHVLFYACLYPHSFGSAENPFSVAQRRKGGVSQPGERVLVLYIFAALSFSQRDVSWENQGEGEVQLGEGLAENTRSHHMYKTPRDARCPDAAYM